MVRRHLIVLAGLVLLNWPVSSPLISSVQAQGSLMVNPKRIVLDGTKRTDNITLYNTSDDTGSFAITFRHYEMNPDGSFKDIDSVKSDVMPCDSLVRYFPSQVTLAPHESQIVRIRFTKPKDLAVGEYRSHLFFRAVERVKAIEAQPVDTSKKVLSFDIRPVFGLAIPIIVRNQTTKAVVSLKNLALSAPDTAGKLTATVDITRTGNESCYGSLILSHKADNGTVTQLGLIQGIAVYVPLGARHNTMVFKVPDGVNLSSGTLRMEYQSLTDAPKETTLAAIEIPLKKS